MMCYSVKQKGPVNKAWEGVKGRGYTMKVGQHYYSTLIYKIYVTLCFKKKIFVAVIEEGCERKKRRGNWTSL